MVLNLFIVEDQFISYNLLQRISLISKHMDPVKPQPTVKIEEQDYRASYDHPSCYSHSFPENSNFQPNFHMPEPGPSFPWYHFLPFYPHEHPQALPHHELPFFIRRPWKQESGDSPQSTDKAIFREKQIQVAKIEVKIEPQQQKQIKRVIDTDHVNRKIYFPKDIKCRTKLNKQRKLRNNNFNYYWSKEENINYCRFLWKHPGIFQLPTADKKLMKVNVLLSKKVKTRTPQQCHTHTQKMLKKYGSFAKIAIEMAQQLGVDLQADSNIQENKVRQEIPEQNLIFYQNKDLLKMQVVSSEYQNAQEEQNEQVNISKDQIKRQDQIQQYQQK